MSSKNIFLFDKNKCVACGACKVACVTENGMQQPEQWRNIYSSNSNHLAEKALVHLSLACNHCEDSPCLVNCPANAYYRDEITGAVLHDKEKCIGCKYCTWTCPYDAPKYNPQEGIVNKCTFCADRVRENAKPACASLCPTGALDFTCTEFSREESEKSSPVQINVGSKIKVTELRNDKAPEMDRNLFTKQIKEENSGSKKITAKHEWPLVIFTFLISVIVGIILNKIDLIQSFEMKFSLFTAGALSSLLSMLHLGKKIRSWRSLLNIKNSWISREIWALSLFMGSLFTDFFITDIPDLIITFSSVLLIISIDMLYTKAMWSWKSKIHHGQTIFIAGGLAVLLSGNFLLIVILYGVRLFFAVYRNYQTIESKYVIVEYFLAFTGFALIQLYGLWAGIACIIVSDILARIDFYNDLSLPKIEVK
ncbi:MAG: DmsC/YnfH family molybdoenzyme membrane anchor subunit [Rhodothermaceae bacterium]